jgi:alpha-L-fucosidase 2
MNYIKDYKLVWNTLGNDCNDSMPLGNGDIGLNVWTEQNGDIVFYIAKTNSLDEYCKLYKLGRIRLSTTPNLILEGQSFSQILDIENGRIIIKNDKISVCIWVSSNYPEVHVDFQSDQDVSVVSSAELWRLEERIETNTQVGDMFKNIYGEDPYETVITTDTVLKTDENNIAWLHLNQYSTYQINMDLQGLSQIAGQYPDILFARASGCLMSGENFEKSNDLSIHSKSPSKNQHVSITCLTLQPTTNEKWYEEIKKIHNESIVDKELTQKYWNEFWDKSYILLDDDENKTDAINRSYIYQRFMNACAGRGALPFKFNGSLFTVDAENDPDYRRWGAGFWFQNTRLCYWPMFAAGDFDLLKPFFKMYTDMIPLLKDRNQIYYNHKGVHYSETSFPWGTHVNAHFGWEREDLDISFVKCPYITYYWQSGIELVEMMLEYYSYTSDENFARNNLLVLAKEIADFYCYHYERDVNGKIVISPAESLETWHEAINPTPEIAGLNSILTKLISLPESIVSKEQKSEWAKLLSDLPELPTGLIDDEELILPAAEYSNYANCENPELYAIFPYRTFGVGKPNIELAQRTFDKRLVKNHFCWHQDDIQAAYLGRAQEAAGYVLDRTSGKAPNMRFPAFWDMFNDWIPDMDHGGVFMKALQSMLVQSDVCNDKIYILPAFPRDWNVRFKLYADKSTIVEGVFRNGKIEKIETSPGERMKDIVVCEK